MAASPTSTSSYGQRKTTAKKGGKSSQAKPAGNGAKHVMHPMMAPPPIPAWDQFPINKKTTMLLDFSSANPDAVFSLFSRTSGITILKDPSFTQTITVTSASAVNLDSAFNILNTELGFYGYQLSKQGDLLIVGKIPPPPPPRPQMPPQPPPPPPPITKVYALNYADATQVAKIIMDVYGPGQGQQNQPQQGGFPGMMFNNGMPPGMMAGGMPGGGQPQKTLKVTSDPYSNSVIVYALQQDQTDIQTLIGQLDIKTGTPLESAVFHVKHVAVDQVVQAIQDVLAANDPTGKGSRSQSQGGQGGFSYNFYEGGYTPPPGKGEQNAVAIKQTNSVIVNATHENLALVRQLLDNLDQTPVVATTTFYEQLKFAKATDVAALLNNVFTQQQNNNNSNRFYSFFNYTPSSSDDEQMGLDEDGNMVNIRNMTGNVNVTADPNTNSLIVVTDPSNMPLIRPIIKRLDQPADQVMIETIIVQATLDNTTKLGAEWNFLPKSLFGGHATGSGSTNFGVQSSNPTGLSYTLSSAAYSAFVNALQTDSRFQVLSAPRVFASNNVKSTINVGTTLQVASGQSSVAGTTTVSYTPLNVGVELDVTPRVTASNTVSMDVNQTDNDLQGYSANGEPIVDNRTATTTITVADGKTVVLGGIISRQRTLNANKVPILGDIPLIGNLFKSTSNEIQQTELLVLLTPHIIRTAADADSIRADQTLELSKQSQKALEQSVGGK